jgi:hypothetical protein
MAETAPKPQAPQATIPGLPPVLGINSDPLNWPRLPAAAKTRLRDLRLLRDDSRNLARAIGDERNEARQTRAAAEGRLKELIGGRRDSPWGHVYSHYDRLPDDDPRVVEQNRLIADATANLARLNVLADERSARAGQLGSLVSNVEEYLTTRLGKVATIKLHDGPVPTRKRSESIADAIERCRRRIRELVADRHAIASAPWHAAQAKARAKIEVEKLAARGEPNVLSLIESATGTIGWREQAYVDARVGDRMLYAAGDAAALPLLCWLHRDALIAKINRQIDVIADDKAALTREQRNEKIKEIDGDLLAVERDEEFWVGTAIADGMNILRRSDADPRAVLGLGEESPAPR